MQTELAAEMRSLDTKSKTSHMLQAMQAILACTADTIAASQKHILEHLTASLGIVPGKQEDLIPPFANLLKIMHAGSQKHVSSKTHMHEPSP